MFVTFASLRGILSVAGSGFWILSSFLGSSYSGIPSSSLLLLSSSSSCSFLLLSISSYSY